MKFEKNEKKNLLPFLKRVQYLYPSKSVLLISEQRLFWLTQDPAIQKSIEFGFNKHYDG